MSAKMRELTANNLSSIKWAMLAFAILVLLAVPKLMLSVTEWRAQGLCEVVAELRVGQDLDLSDHRLQKYSSYRWSDESPCNGGRGAAYQFVNPLLSRLHLAPGNQVNISLETYNGKLTKKTIQVMGEPRYGAVVSQTLTDVCGRRTGEISAHRKVNRFDYGPYFKKVEIIEDTGVPASQLNADWKLDLSCFASMHPCSQPERVLNSGLTTSIR